MKKHIIAADIIWDTDGKNVELPCEVGIPDCATSFLDDDPPPIWVVESEVLEYLSNKFGWLVTGIKVMIEDKNICSNPIDIMTM
ncbi:MAG: hypothetical protein IMZ64_05505 [Bacteroidetes bacterium]|nr:hypothetical protein [Bacteroidota bacterium]